jgi:hypothetical protein
MRIKGKSSSTESNSLGRWSLAKYNAVDQGPVCADRVGDGRREQMGYVMMFKALKGRPARICLGS